MTDEVNLLVNGMSIPLDDFARGFVGHTISGMLASLKGTEEIKTLKITIVGDKVEIILNNAPVPAKPFVNKIFKSTIMGMISPLKGVGEINRVSLSFRRQSGTS